MQRVIARGIPAVFVDAALCGPGYTSGRTDTYKGGCLAARCLLRMGHPRVMFVNDLSDATLAESSSAGLRSRVPRGGLRGREEVGAGRPLRKLEAQS